MVMLGVTLCQGGQVLKGRGEGLWGTLDEGIGIVARGVAGICRR